MPKLELKFSVDITDAEQGLLCNVLGCKAGAIAAQLSEFGPAALREYIDMFVGAAPISSAGDMKERRLVALMLTKFSAQSPDAVQVARLFNITQNAARALLRAVAGKHRLKISAQIDQAIREVLGKAKQASADQPYTVVIRDRLIVELLNADLASSTEPKTPVARSKNTANSFAIDEGSLNYLKTVYP